jgi:hypothetical protein
VNDDLEILGGLARLANTGEVAFSITLLLDGQIVMGTTISRATYVALLIDQIVTGIRAARHNLDDRAVNGQPAAYLSDDAVRRHMQAFAGADDGPVDVVYLTDATIVQPTGERVRIQLLTVFLRQVSGWTLEAMRSP